MNIEKRQPRQNLVLIAAKTSPADDTEMSASRQRVQTTRIDSIVNCSTANTILPN